MIPRTEMDIAVVGLGVSLTLAQGVCTAARVGLGAVAPTALLVEPAAQALIGSRLDDAALEKAAEACRAACEELARDTADGGPAALVGLPWVEDGKLHNAMALLNDGRIEAVRFKVDLPNYGVFDEKRVFAPGPAPGPIVFRGLRVGVPICEDIWGPDPVECILDIRRLSILDAGDRRIQMAHQRMKPLQRQMKAFPYFGASPSTFALVEFGQIGPV